MGNLLAEICVPGLDYIASLIWLVLIILVLHLERSMINQTVFSFFSLSL